MTRARLAVASALLLFAAPFATSSHASAITCSPVAADVCATYVFVCQRAAYHNIYLAACHLT